MKRTDVVCYLDYDGVIHHEAVYFRPRHGNYIGVPERTLFEWMPILEELLAPYPEVAIVLSTSWVRVRSFDFARKQLSSQLQERVIGATFHRRHMHSIAFAMLPRGVQILDDVARRKLKSWFAIDDDDYCWPDPYRDNLIKTDGTTGLNSHQIKLAVQRKLANIYELKNARNCEE